jgi:NAD-dependent SIR2 family protein deacetylase
MSAATVTRQSIFSHVKDFKLSHLRPTKTVVHKMPVVGHAPPSLNEPLNERSTTQQSTTPISSSCGEDQRLNTNTVRAHGQLGADDWAKPRLAVKCTDEARPGYNSCSAAEYLDEPDVLDKKVELVAQLIRQSSYRVIYSGAGISTASGIADYASKAAGSVSKKLQQEKWHPKRPISPYDAQPTLSHKILTAMHRDGHLDYWVQQNHDGLPQKAGFPQHAINEIHGAWYDPSNPVVAMNGNLRNDLFSDLLQCERKIDFCLVLGTSLCGMNSDRIVTAAANSFTKSQGKTQEKSCGGAVIVGLQATKMDHVASVRIFATIDTMMRLLAEKLKMTGDFLQEEAGTLKSEEKSLGEASLELKPCPSPRSGDLFNLPYDSRSGKRNSGGELSPFDFRANAFIKINGGPHDGAPGFVSGINRDGHFKMTFFLSLEWKSCGNADTQLAGSEDRGSFESKMARKPHPFNCVLGRWWIDAAKNESVSVMPVTNLSQSNVADAKEIAATKAIMKKLSLGPTCDASWH